MTTTRGSRRISTRRASFTAWIMFISGIGADSAYASGPRKSSRLVRRLLAVLRDLGGELRGLLFEVPGHVGVDVFEHAAQRRLGRLLLGVLERVGDLVQDLAAHGGLGGV